MTITKDGEIGYWLEYIKAQNTEHFDCWIPQAIATAKQIAEIKACHHTLLTLTTQIDTLIQEIRELKKKPKKRKPKPKKKGRK